MKMTTVGEMPYTRRDARELVDTITDDFVLSTNRAASVKMQGNVAEIELYGQPPYRFTVTFVPESNDHGRAQISVDDHLKRLIDEDNIKHHHTRSIQANKE